ncbi:MAG: hypothetical protein KJ060_03705 [Candidatus Hydrogenedentes bacterium]|nr:hypothetical protein [Candidatus Hydrogenedentota bacterium]
MRKSLQDQRTSLVLLFIVVIAITGCTGGSGKNLTADLEGRRVEWFDVEGNWAAYRWTPNNSQTTPQAIVLRELGSGAETEIESGGNYGSVAIDGGIVVYVKRGGSGEPSAIVAYTVNSGASETIATGRIDTMDAGAGRAVWDDSQTGLAMIGSLAGGGGSAMDAVENVSDFMPRIGTMHAVWVRNDRATRENRLMVYDLSAGSASATEITSPDRVIADVSSGNVVYCVFGQPEDAIHIYNIATRSDNVIATSPRIVDEPRIEGNYVVWLEHISRDEFSGVAGQPLYDERDFRNLLRHDLASGSTKELAHNVFGLRDPLPAADGTVYARAPRAITPPGQSNTGDLIDIRAF